MTMGLEMTYSIVDNSDLVAQATTAAIARTLTIVGDFVAGEAADELENDPRRVDTGRLKNSITFQPNESEKAVYVGTNVEYAIYVHEGTSRMDPNRFLKNAVERNIDQIKTDVENELKNG